MKLPTNRHFDCTRRCQNHCAHSCMRLGYPRLIETVRYLAAHPGDLAQLKRAEKLLRELGELA